MEWQDELTLIAETAAENRVNKNGFAVKPEESARTVFCNKKTVGYSEYFKSQQTGKLVEAKYEVHKAEDVYKRQEIYCLAPKLDQAALVYDGFYQMVQAEDELAELAKKRRKIGRASCRERV